MKKLIFGIVCLSFLIGSCYSGNDEEIKDAFGYFKENFKDQDSIKVCIDQASIEYFREILEVAKNENTTEIQNYIEASDYPYTNYPTILNTKYIYLEARKEEGVSDEELLDEFLFFSRLSTLGLWGISDQSFVEGCSVSKVKFKSSTEAIATIVCGFAQNKVKKEKYTLTADVPFHKEENRWKINIPATMSIAEDKIKIALLATRTSKKEYRDAVVDRIVSTTRDSSILWKW